MALRQRHLKTWWHDRRGNTGIIFALAFVPTVLVAGGTVDIGNVYNERARLQAAADAAVVTANVGSELTQAARQEIALKAFRANVGNNPLLAGITPSFSFTGETINLSASAPVPTPFLQLMQMPSMTITAYASSAARVTSVGTANGKVCLLALDPTSADGIHIQGDNDIKYIDCWAHTNSLQPTAINADGSQATAVGQGHCAVGASVVPHDNFSPVVKTGCLEVKDPFAATSAYPLASNWTANFTLPNVAYSCKASNLNLKKGTYTLDPGRYCGGIEIQAHATVTFNPGIYVIDNGRFLVQSGSNVSGSNVLFYFTGANARMTLIGGGTVNLKGRTGTSSYAGFLFLAHANANPDGESNIQGGGTMKLEGVLYMPRQRIEVSGNGDVNGNTGFFAMVAKDFYFRGNGIFNLKRHTGATTVHDIMAMIPTETQRESYMTN